MKSARRFAPAALIEMPFCGLAHRTFAISIACLAATSGDVKTIVLTFPSPLFYIQSHKITIRKEAHSMKPDKPVEIGSRVRIVKGAGRGKCGKLDSVFTGARKEPVCFVVADNGDWYFKREEKLVLA